ncbi:hypothetical protein KIW84_042019 [Lathyrus oleraceus]|uniref:Helitron helicase-like domain-containing protein n=1 Tax=Pisum sativum TaxID=3888 RepID=A0A9D5AM69_PEA|nr:hypothetical protein KIW84_042019 [Pisum sativum]
MLPLLCRNNLIPTVQEKHSSVQRNQHVLPVEHDVRHPINVPIVTVQKLYPIFTPTVNLDFNTDDNDDSDYDPFATHQSEDDTCLEFDDQYAAFVISEHQTGTTEDMYTIEFQKKGLPHAHILIFLHPSNKYPRPGDIDKIISVEVSDPLKDQKLYNLAKTHMVHGPYG